MQIGFVSIKRVARMNDPLDGKKVQNVAGATCGSGGGCNSENNKLNKLTTKIER